MCVTSALQGTAAETWQPANVLGALLKSSRSVLQCLTRHCRASIFHPLVSVKCVSVNHTLIPVVQNVGFNPVFWRKVTDLAGPPVTDQLGLRTI